jgi:chromosome segregation ATPase
MRLAELRAEIRAAAKASKGQAPAADVSDLDARRTKLERRRARYVEAYADEAMTREELQTKIAKLDAERLRLDAEQADAAAPGLADPTVRRELAATYADIERAWLSATPAGKRAIVNALVREVRVIGDIDVLQPTWRSSEELTRQLSTLVDALETAGDVS